MTLIFFWGGGGGEEVRWKTVRTYGKILATPLDKATETVVLYSPSLSLKTLDTGILLLAVFTLELEMDCPSETSPCTGLYSRPPPPQTPLLRFFLRGEGGCTQAI